MVEGALLDYFLMTGGHDKGHYSGVSQADRTACGASQMVLRNLDE